LDLNKESFKKMFPNIAKEIESGENRVQVNSVRTDSETGERAASPERLVNYSPDVVDFIRRCDTLEQAEEIIAYMEKRGEIGYQYAERLRQQLKSKGLRSFGPKKKENHYLGYGSL